MRCLNWKVIAALAAAGLGIYVLAPTVAAAALPLLIVAACPLSMLLMMRAMGASRSTGERSEVAGLREEIAEFRHQRPAAPADAAPRRGD